MRADLKSLKDRLGDEVGELGIDRTKAETLLSSHYKAQEAEDPDAPPPKVSSFDLMFLAYIFHCRPYRFCFVSTENSPCRKGGTSIEDHEA